MSTPQTHKIPLIYFDERRLSTELKNTIGKSVQVSIIDTDMTICVDGHKVFLPKILRQTNTIESLTQSLKDKGIIKNE